MISAHANDTLPVSGPLTHRAYTAHVVTAALQRAVVPIVHVQLRRKGAVLCGTVAEMVEDFNESGQEWFKVDCPLGRVWVESKNLRLCSGDGRCSCEAGA